jgi:hypothetical protein
MKLTFVQNSALCQEALRYHFVQDAGLETHHSSTSHADGDISKGYTKYIYSPKVLKIWNEVF